MLCRWFWRGRYFSCHLVWRDRCHRAGLQYGPRSLLLAMVPDFNPWRVGYPERGNIIVSLIIALFVEKKGAIASRRLDFYLLVHGRCFISPSTTHWKPMEAFPYPPPGDAL
ncbi:hypothetical protein TNCV_2726871 [Trichonephila clavipes]|nr:hypothetical protein TNCV_2726871 [Trichonephila clavipes]